MSFLRYVSGYTLTDHVGNTTHNTVYIKYTVTCRGLCVSNRWALDWVIVFTDNFIHTTRDYT
jgi:hypothetical protein